VIAVSCSRIGIKAHAVELSLIELIARGCLSRVRALWPSLVTLLLIGFFWVGGRVRPIWLSLEGIVARQFSQLLGRLRSDNRMFNLMRNATRLSYKDP